MHSLPNPCCLRGKVSNPAWRTLGVRQCRCAPQFVVRSSEGFQYVPQRNYTGESDSLRELPEWLERQGAIGIRNAECVSHLSGERGLVAMREFSRGEMIFCLPLECTICDWPDNCIGQVPPVLPSSVRLAVMLLRYFADAGLIVPGAQSPGPEPPPAKPQPQPQSQPQPSSQPRPQLRPSEHPHQQQQQTHKEPQQYTAREIAQFSRRKERVKDVGARQPHPCQQGDGNGITSRQQGSGPLDRTGPTPHGYWGPYLRSLPLHPAALLLQLQDPADLAFFEYPPLERAVASYRDLVAEYYARCGGVQGLNGASLEQFSWALAIVGSRSLGTSLLLMALYTLPVGGVEASQDGLTRSYPRDAAAAPAAGETAPSVSAAAAPSTSAACISQPLSSFPSQEATLSSLPLATPSTPMPLMMMALIQMTSLSWARSDVASSSPSSPPPSCPPAPAPAPAARAASAAPAAPAPAPASPDVNHDYKERRGNGSDGGPKKAMWPDSCSAEAESRGAPGGEVGGSGSYINPFGGDRVDASRGPVTGGQLRMLVPMLDLINHSGVRQKGGYTGDDSVVVSGANVRWELRPPAVGQRPTARSVVDSCRNRGSGSGRGQGQFAQRSSEALHGDDGQGDGGAGGIGSRSGWQIALVATADLATGQELLMCYDTTASNDSLALHYGFVENLNPNEDVQLYDSLEDALAWHREVVLAEAAAAAAAPAASAASGLVTSGGFLATRRMKSLGPDALATWYDTASAAAAASVVATSMACGDVVAEITTPVKLGRGNRLCPRLQAAFRHLAQSASLDFGTEDSDAGRIPGSTGSSGSTVASGGSSRDQIEGGETDVFPDIDKRLAELVVRRCVQLLQCRAPLLADLVELLLDAQQRQLKVPRTCPQEQQGVSGEPVQDGTAVWQALCQHFAEALAAKCADLQLLAGLDLPAVSAALARRGPTDQCGPPQVQHLDGRGCVVTSGLPLLTWQRRLALEYRVQKKTILWDYVLAHALD